MNSFLRSSAAALPSVCIVVAFAGVAIAADKSPAAAPEPMVRVQNVEVIASPVGAVVVLKLRDKSIPVFVDSLVAISIRSALAGEAPARPLSHDLMQTILESLDAKVTQAVITLKDGTFYGALTIDVAGKPKVFDCRSSDAIALAVRFKAPILLDPSLVESAGVEPMQERVRTI